MDISIYSETSGLNGVILHTPGHEVENMIPENVERALYSDILNLNVAGSEYSQFSLLLKKMTRTYEVRELLSDILADNDIRQKLIYDIFRTESIDDNIEYILSRESAELSRMLIEGTLMKKNTLTKFLDKNRYSLRPLHNFFFTRDASISIFDRVLAAKMKSKVRMRESTIMEAIFKYHPEFKAATVNTFSHKNSDKIVIEGGDIIVAGKDVLLIGIGPRTNSYGVDFIIDVMLERKVKRDLIIQQLPSSPESFIHLDMAFTFLDEDKCMIYEPLIMDLHYSTVHIAIDNGEVKKIRYVENILSALKSIGIEMQPLLCGGNNDRYIQEREQWHSGANFFAAAPGKIIGYGRNLYTIEELSNHGFEVLTAKDIVDGKTNPDDYKKCVITIEGSELARGGGGARCMTMPVNRVF